MTLTSVTVIAVFRFVLGTRHAVVADHVAAVPLRYSARSMTWIHHGLQGVIGAATIALGLTHVYELALR